MADTIVFGKALPQAPFGPIFGITGVTPALEAFATGEATLTIEALDATVTVVQLPQPVAVILAVATVETVVQARATIVGGK